jgi:hypothetical protein
MHSRIQNFSKESKDEWKLYGIEKFKASNDENYKSVRE